MFDPLYDIRQFSGELFGPELISTFALHTRFWSSWDLIDRIEANTTGRIFVQKLIDDWNFYFQKHEDWIAYKNLNLESLRTKTTFYVRSTYSEMECWLSDNMSGPNKCKSSSNDIEVSLQSFDDIALFKLQYGEHIRSTI